MYRARLELGGIDGDHSDHKREMAQEPAHQLPLQPADRGFEVGTRDLAGEVALKMCC